MKKDFQVSESVLLAVILTVSGGFMDAYSYLCRGEVFANAQTGNILLLGVNMFEGKWEQAVQYLCPIAAFSVGIGAAVMARYFFKEKNTIHWRQITVLMEAAVLFAVSLMPREYNLLANSLTSLACGAQVESFRKINGNPAATTMCIGNLRTATQSLCDAALKGDTGLLKKGLMFYCFIIIFVAGAVTGSFFVGIWAQKAILISSALMLAAFLMMFIQPGGNNT